MGKSAFSSQVIQPADVLVLAPTFFPTIIGGSLTWVCLGGDQGVYKEKLPGLGVTSNCAGPGSGETQECCS